MIVIIVLLVLVSIILLDVALEGTLIKKLKVAWWYLKTSWEVNHTNKWDRMTNQKWENMKGQYDELRLMKADRSADLVRDILNNATVVKVTLHGKCDNKLKRRITKKPFVQ